MKIYTIALLLVFEVTTVMAQDITPPKFKNEDYFSNYVYDELNKRLSKFSGICTKALGTVQLTLNSKGHIKKVSITGDMPDLLRQQLREIVLSSDGLWTPMKINTKRSTSLPIVMFINIHIADGCESLYHDVLYLDKQRFDFYKSLNNALSETSLPVNCFLINQLYFVRDYGYLDLNPKK
jgi:hypothetical protein